MTNTKTRQRTHYIEEARALERLMRLHGLSQEQAALRVGKSQSAVANKLRILRHSDAVLAALRAHALTERHARALLRLSTEQARLDAIALIAERALNVAKAEQYIDSLLAKAPQCSLPALLGGVEHSLSCLRSAGIRADFAREESDAEIIFTIRIEKTAV